MSSLPFAGVAKRTIAILNAVRAPRDRNANRRSVGARGSWSNLSSNRTVAVPAFA